MPANEGPVILLSNLANQYSHEFKEEYDSLRHRVVDASKNFVQSVDGVNQSLNQIEGNEGKRQEIVAPLKDMVMHVQNLSEILYIKNNFSVSHCIRQDVACEHLHMDCHHADGAAIYVQRRLLCDAAVLHWRTRARRSRMGWTSGGCILSVEQREQRSSGALLLAVVFSGPGACAGSIVLRSSAIPGTFKWRINIL